MGNELTLQLDPDEHILHTVRRSLFGVLPHLFFAAITFIGLIVFTYTVALYPERVEKAMPQVAALAVAIGVATLIELVIYILVSTYFQNLLVLTNQSIIQRLQFTPFSSNISQLDLSNIEDVTLKQNGFFPTILNFGTLIVETAGEQANFVFKFARLPKQAAKAIIEAHEAVTKPSAAPPGGPSADLPT